MEQEKTCVFKRKMKKTNWKSWKKIGDEKPKFFFGWKNKGEDKPEERNKKRKGEGRKEVCKKRTKGGCSKRKRKKFFSQK